jgi:hypothetical protein
MGNGAFDAALNPDMSNGGPMTMNKTASASLAVMQQPLNRATLHHAPTASTNIGVMPSSATLDGAALLGRVGVWFGVECDGRFAYGERWGRAVFKDFWFE